MLLCCVEVHVLVCCVQVHVLVYCVEVHVLVCCVQVVLVVSPKAMQYRIRVALSFKAALEGVLVAHRTGNKGGTEDVHTARSTFVLLVS